MARLEFFLFGPPTLKRDGLPLKIDARKTVALLAYLAVTGISHSRETLLALLWPELDPQRAQNVLRRNLSILNKTLDSQWLVLERDIVGLDKETYVWLDVEEFRRLAQSWQDHGHPPSELCPTCMNDLTAAVTLYRADFLAGFGVRNSPSFETWQLLEMEQLQRELASVLERLVDSYENQADYEQAISYAQRWLALDPLRETVHRRLMRLYAASGDRTAALRQYQSSMQLLDKELGVAPEAETTALYESLRQEGSTGRKSGEANRVAVEEAGPPPPSPYRGLFAFQEQDASFFFGREVFVQKLLDQIQARSLVAVIGPSGSGKSSVLFAGLFPHLRQEESWNIIHFRPGSDPFLGLSAALLPHLDPELSAIDNLVETRKLALGLRKGEIHLPDVVARISQKSGGESCLLLVTDQFEELYTICPESELRQAFLQVLLDTISQQSFQRQRNFTFVFTLRADFMEQALAFRPLADAVQDAGLLLGPMLREELSQAIQLPAAEQGVTFEAGLVERILDDVGGEPGNLPLLEFALAMLWEQQRSRVLTHAGYEAIARVEGALTRHADQVYARLDTAEQENARRTFVQLVRPGEGTEDTRRIARRDELSEEDWALVQHLADARLVVTGRDAVGDETVEVVHEALIRNWDRFRLWMEEDRVFRAWQERLRASIRQWEGAQYNEGALLRGVPLAEAEGWLLDRGDELGQAECAFIEASIALREERDAAREGERLARERLRQRIIQGLMAGAAIAILLSALAGWQWLRAEQQRELAANARIREDVERDLAQSALSRQLATQADTLLADQLDLGLLLSIEASRIANTVEARRNLRVGLTANDRLSSYLHGHDDRVTSVAISADGRILASGSNDNTVLLWDAAGGQPLGPALIGHTDNVLSIDISPNGQVVASGSADKTIKLWDAATGEPLGPPLSGHTKGVSSVAFSPDGQTLASSGGETILLWDLTSSPVVSETLSGHTAEVRSVAFSPDGQMLASGGDDETILLWDVLGREPAGPPLRGHSDRVRSVAFSPDGQTLASADESGSILIWEMGTNPALANNLSVHGSSIRSVAFSPDPLGRTQGDILASAGTDGIITFWDVAGGEQLGEPLSGHTDWVRSIAFSPDGRSLASASHDKSIILWDVSGRQKDAFALDPPLAEHLGSVRALAVSPDGHTMASGSDDETIILWDMENGAALGPPLKGHKGGVRSLAFTPDGRMLASGSDDETIILWDVASREALGAPLEGHIDSVHSVAFSPNGRSLVSGSKDGTLILWDAASGETLGPAIDAHAKGVQSVAVSPDGHLLASAGDDNNIKLWDITGSPHLSSTLSGHDDVVFAIAFSPDGQTLASSSWDKKILLWDVAGGQTIGLPMTGHTESVQDVTFSPDGQTLASGSWDETVMLWDSASGLSLTPRPPMSEHKGSVRSVVFNPDGETLASAGDDGTIILWDVNLESWQAKACARAGRSLSKAEWRRYFGEQIYVATCPDYPAPAD